MNFVILAIDFLRKFFFNAATDFSKSLALRQENRLALGMLLRQLEEVYFYAQTRGR